jgi:hypothetical protein
LRRHFARLSDGEDNADVAAALATIEVECQQLFAAYVSRRAALLQVCDDIDSFVARPPARFFSTGSLLRLAAVALPTAAVLAAGAAKPRAALARVARRAG